MKKKYIAKGQNLTEKWWAVVFLHSEGWTISSFHNIRHYALADLKNQKEMQPDFRYKVVQVDVSYTTP